MALTLEEKLEICQNTINDLQKENANLKQENEEFKNYMSMFTDKNKEQQVVDYIALLKDTIDTTTTERNKLLKDMKKQMNGIKKARRSLERLTTKTKLEMWLSGKGKVGE